MPCLTIAKIISEEIKKRDKEKSKYLENIVDNKNEKYITKIKYQEKPEHQKYHSDSFLEALAKNEDPISGAKIERTYSSNLPPGVLGFYEPDRHTITLPYDNNIQTLKDTYFHEVAHAKGFVTEYLTEEYGQAIQRGLI